MNFFIILPQVISIIKAIEELLPDTPGNKKFEALILTIEGIYGNAVENLPALQKFVTAVVNIANALGIFKKRVSPAG